MGRLVTHKEIHQYLRDTLGVNVTEAAVINYGSKGYFGKSDGGFPRRYKWSIAKQAAANIPDKRIRLTSEQVQQIRESSGEKNVVLSRRFGVTESYISRIRKGERRSDT